MGNAIIDTYSGILRRDGIDLPCTIMGRRVTLPGTNLFEHVRPSIVRVDGETFDGIYELLADGKSVRIRLQDGRWLAA